MELSIIEILLGMGIGMMILFFGLWSGGSVGRADGMILVVSGIFLGFEKNVEVFVMGLFLAGITSLFLSVIRRKGRTYRIPFAPFLLAGYLFVMVME
jgi:leader peptidase (prepilin peptidase)/N-methyltransferase